MMWAKKAIVATIVAVLMICAVPTSESSATSENNESFVDAGYLESSESFFYYAKFGLNGFPFTNNSTSGDKPGVGVGEVIGDNTIFATVSGLDMSKDYCLFVEQFSGDISQAILIIDLGTGFVGRTAWISIDDPSKAYVNGTESDLTFKSGALSAIDADSKLIFSLYEKVSGGIDSMSASDDFIVRYVEDSPMNKTTIIDHYITSNSGDTNLIEDIGKNHGWSASKASDVHYAGKKIATDIGNYICVFFVTNAESPVIEVIQGGHKYTVSPESTFYNFGSTDSGYGYAYINVQDMPGFDRSNDDYIVKILKDGNVLADTNVPSESGDNIGLFICIGAIAVIAIVILAYWALNSRR